MQITEKQLALVNDRLQAILRSDNYFAKLYKERGITEVKTVEDFKKLPFVDKAELRNAYPLGIQAAPDDE
ncbi:MAG: phenylacetate--CoA ligase family protein, partial [Ruminococcus sp.]|nr:phenylacetate--CoA ligase family protein [Ruminococcus sp.]